MSLLVVPLAHAGEGATWQALLSVLAVGIAVVFLLVVIGRVQLGSGNDLVLPLAAVAIIASLAPTASGLLSDWVWWAFPVGCVLLAMLLVVAFTQVDLTTPLALLSVALAALAVVAFDDPITRAWHPAPELLPRSVDAEVTITSPEDGTTVEAGDLRVEIAVTGGSIGPGGLTEEQIPADPEQLGALNVFLDGQPVDTGPVEDCTVASPCQSVTYELDVDSGEHNLIVEFVRGDGTVFAPTVFAGSDFTAG